MTETNDPMFEEIVKDINERISSQPDSRCATADEVTICWLVAEVQQLRKDLEIKNETIKTRSSRIFRRI